jgi:hypothetical protein
MSDTNAPAAPPSAPPASAPVQHEVPIDTSQTSSPSPVGDQAPDKPPPTRREAIQAAFDRANKPREQTKPDATKPPPKAAEAKAGHNQPPEPTEKIDLKRRPDDQPRDRGRFAPRAQPPADGAQQSADSTQQSANGTQPSANAQTVRQLPENTPFREPPPRMSDKAKAEWHATPESVRGDMHRMHQEFGNAYSQLKPVADAFQPIARFHHMAQQHGTTLERALTNYTLMEQKLREDVVGGLDVIVNNLGLTDPNTKQRIGLRDIAYHVLSQSPEQLQQLQMGNQQTAASHQIGALHQEIQGLKNQLQQMHTQQQFSYTRAQVDQFADSHPRFDEIGTTVKQELDLGFDLETAYRRAELLAPATQAAQTRGNSTSAQTRPADRSISGSPGGVAASAASSRRSEKPVGRREAIENAIKRVQGGL